MLMGELSFQNKCKKWTFLPIISKVKKQMLKINANFSETFFGKTGNIDRIVLTDKSDRKR